MSRFHRRIILGLAFAFFFELADLNTFAYAATGLHKYLGLTLAQIGDITSASFAGIGTDLDGRVVNADDRVIPVSSPPGSALGSTT